MFDNGFSELAVLVVLVVLLVQKFLHRNRPRVGGKVGRRIAGGETPVTDGFSRVVCREITVFGAPSEGALYPTLKTYLRGVVRRPGRMHVYRVAACTTRIEVPAAAPDYQRIEPAEALALLRELPDPRLVRRLHLSDDPSFLDPWVRKVSGQNVFHLANATSSGIVVMYRPDRRLGGQVGLTLAHEWLHLVAFKSAKHVRRFRRANAIEQLPPLQFEPVSFGDRRTPIYEAWSELGESLLGYDEASARRVALASPVHAMIVWRRVEEIMRKTPARLRSTRFAELEARAAFMRTQVEPRARAVRKSRSFWSRLRRIAVRR
jgi:hypothetical protein